MGFIYSNLGTLSEYIGDITTLLHAYARLESALENGDTESALAHLKQISAEKERIDLSYLMDDIGDLISESLDGADRVRKIVLNLKEFSHVGREEKMPADINAGVESTLNIVHNELKYKATIEKEYADLPPVSCFMQELNQVFMNLLVNAGQAIEDQGTIRIATYEEPTAVCIAIADSGQGMSAEVQKRIFEPFFTTKKVGQGTGLGLSMAYQIIVEKHGGQLLVESQPGQGTTFTIKLPKDV
jgi:two-component system NtrC family sensor kinase